MGHERTMIAYDFLSPPRIVFGWGRRAEAGALAATLGQRALLVRGSRTLERSPGYAEIVRSLEERGIEPVPLALVSEEPTPADVDAVVARLRQDGPRPGDFVLAVGGGSAIDLAKAVAALATNPHGSGVCDFLEGVGRGLTIDRPPLPVMALPTTAGTGSEATKNAVISSYDPPFKKSLRSDQMVPRVVLIDPELHTTLPPHVTAHTGMDAITQLIESYLSRRAKPIPQALCLQGLDGALPALIEAVENGASRAARETMAHAALLSGMALANSGLGLAHGVAAALGALGRVPHGLACAVMLPAAMRFNRTVRAVELARLAPLLIGDPLAHDPDAAIEAVEHTAARLGIPRRLSDLGITADQLPALVSASHGNSLSGNPRDVSDDELRQLLEQML